MTHQQRLEQLREQNRAMARPLCDFSSMPRAEGGPRMRAEWDTRSTINNRFWANVITTGAKQVTAEMLDAHPTHGAWEGNPMDARKDVREWGPSSTIAPQYVPDESGPGKRPTLPDSSLWRNPRFDGWNPENIDTMREVRQIVKESNRWTEEDASLRVQQRTFQHQWMPAQGLEQLEAAERLRWQSDDYRRDFSQKTPS